MRDPHSISYDGALGQQIIEMHVWAVREGLRGAAAAELFDGFCQRLVTARVPLWRGFAGMRTLHPQWAGYTYTWRRDLNAIQPVQFERSDEYEQEVLNSPFTYLSRQAKISTAEGDRGCTCAGVSPDPRQRSIFLPSSKGSPPPVPRIISPRPSASAWMGTPHAESGSAIPSRPIGPKASATMTFCY
jgi:hypothetical protein